MVVHGFRGWLIERGREVTFFSKDMAVPELLPTLAASQAGRCRVLG